MFEALVAIWTIIMILLAGGSHGGVKAKRIAIKPPSPPIVSPGDPTKLSTGEPAKIPTPALLPGMIILLGNVLRKKNKGN